MNLWDTFGRAPRGSASGPRRVAGVPLALLPDRSVTSSAIDLVQQLADSGPEILGLLLLLDAHWYMLFNALTCPDLTIAAKSMACLMKIRQSMDRVCAAAGDGDATPDDDTDTGVPESRLQSSRHDDQQDETTPDGPGDDPADSRLASSDGTAAVAGDQVRPAPIDAQDSTSRGGGRSAPHADRLALLQGVESRVQAKARSRRRVLLAVRDMCDKVSSVLNTLLPEKVNELRAASNATSKALLCAVHTTNARL